jgi:hypothetical protein
MKRTSIVKILLLIPVLLVLVSFLRWTLQEKKIYNIYVLDKTVPDGTRSEHKSFSWILTHNRYADKSKKIYSFKKDYYGFLPLKDDQYKIRSLRLYEVLSIPDELDMVYYTDTYGVTYQDWYHREPNNFHPSLLYGGLNQNDYLLLSEMKRKHKLILCEYNTLASPTSGLIREKTETLFDFSWTGWVGCYISSLKVSNKDLPGWLIAQYEQVNHKKWNFDGPGIILIQEHGNVMVLDADHYLEQPFPQIITEEYGQKTYHLPSSVNYSFWFDIIQTGTSNKVVSSYKLATNKEGTEMLKKAGLTNQFPAIIEHLNEYKFYYFAGDFSDRQMVYATAYLNGLPWLAKYFYTKGSTSKSAFFWNFYYPLIDGVLKKNLSSVERTKL